MRSRIRRIFAGVRPRSGGEFDRSATGRGRRLNCLVDGFAVLGLAIALGAEGRYAERGRVLHYGTQRHKPGVHHNGGDDGLLLNSSYYNRCPGFHRFG